jgi:biopolymer transport protein ExbB/TolQ
VNTATETPFRFHDVLRAAAGALETPVVVLLILLMLGAAALLGWLIAEFITERRHLKVKLPQLLDDMREGAAPLQDIISGSGLLKSQKEALLELTRHPGFTDTMREALAIRLLEQEQAKYDGIVRLSELVSRLGPMIGLLGTLVPLGPGIIALGQGDTYTLSTSLMTAFDTTTAGLSAAAVTSVVSSIRRAWYKDYLSLLEALADGVLEILKEGKEGL